MRTVTFEALYMINTGWKADDMLDIFFSDGRPSETLPAKEASETFGYMLVVYVNEFTVELR